MSTQDRHAKFKARGWKLIYGLGMNGNNQIELWAKPDGSIVHWTPSSTDSPDDAKSETDERWTPEEAPEEFKVLHGVTLPKDADEAGKVIAPNLTWDAPIFVGAAAGITIKLGTLLSEPKDIVPTLKRIRGGRPIVAGPYIKTRDVQGYLERLHDKHRCGYWRIGSYPLGLESYRNDTFLEGRMENDPRPVLPLTYYGDRIRAAVRREALTTPSTSAMIACGRSWTRSGTRSASPSWQRRRSSSSSENVA